MCEVKFYEKGKYKYKIQNYKIHKFMKYKICEIENSECRLSCKNVFACLFSVHNTISLSRHEQVCLMRLRFERSDGRSISRNIASLNILVHDVINLLYSRLSHTFFLIQSFSLHKVKIPHQIQILLQMMTCRL